MVRHFSGFHGPKRTYCRSVCRGCTGFRILAGHRWHSLTHSLRWNVTSTHTAAQTRDAQTLTRACAQRLSKKRRAVPEGRFFAPFVPRRPCRTYDDTNLLEFFSGHPLRGSRGLAMALREGGLMNPAVLSRNLRSWHKRLAELPSSP